MSKKTGKIQTGESYRRDMSIEIQRSVDAEKRTVEVAFSSEAEITRWGEIEVLSHDAGAIRTKRLVGAPGLVLHNPDDQVAVVETFSLDDDRKMRAVLKFSRSRRGEDIYQDVLDGIRRNISVGYVIHAYEKPREGYYLITDWEPFEVSIVGIPADISVGVGRSDDQLSAKTRKEIDEENCQHSRHASEDVQVQTSNFQEQEMSKKRDQDTQEQTQDTTPEVADSAIETERARVREIQEIAGEYRQLVPDANERALAAIGDGVEVREFQQRLLKELKEQSDKTPEVRNVDLGMDERDAKRFSFVRAINALANPTSREAQRAASFEFEVSGEAAKRANIEPKGIYVPPDVLRVRAAGLNTDAKSGGALIDTKLSASLIDLLRPQTVFLKHATVLDDLVGDVDFAKKTQGLQGYWVGESEAPKPSSQKYGRLGLRMKTVAAITDVSRKQLKQSSWSVEGLIRSDLAAALAQAIDIAGFYGSGSDHQPLGLANVKGIKRVTFATPSKPKFDELVNLETQMNVTNLSTTGAFYLMNSAMRGYLKSTVKFSGGEHTLWESGNTVNGYPVEVSNNLKDGDIFFIQFSEVLTGLWGGLDLTTDPYTNADTGDVRVVAFQDLDVLGRYPEAVVLGNQTKAAA